VIPQECEDWYNALRVYQELQLIAIGRGCGGGRVRGVVYL